MQSSRHELKYLVHHSQRDAIAAELLRHMTVDPLGDANGSYYVKSLYYDSPELHFYRSKVEGTKFRRKLRVRVYGQSAACAAQDAMIEIKKKFRRTTMKERLTLPLPEALAFCAGEVDRTFTDPRQAATAGQITALLNALHLRPTCTTLYVRRAFVGSRFEPGLRVTFDAELMGLPPSLEVAGSAADYVMSPEWFLMEVKVNDRIPRWLCALLERHNLTVQRVSKYGVGLEKVRQRAATLTAQLQTALAGLARTLECHASRRERPGEDGDRRLTAGAASHERDAPPPRSRGESDGRSGHALGT